MAPTTNDMLHLLHYWLLTGVDCWLAMQRSEEGRDGRNGAHSSEAAGEDEYEFTGAQAMEFCEGMACLLVGSEARPCVNPCCTSIHGSALPYLKLPPHSGHHLLDEPGFGALQVT